MDVTAMVRREAMQLGCPARHVRGGTIMGNQSRDYWRRAPSASVHSTSMHIDEHAEHDACGEGDADRQHISDIVPRDSLPRFLGSFDDRPLLLIQPHDVSLGPPSHPPTK